jgi:hypothetical protein
MRFRGIDVETVALQCVAYPRGFSRSKRFVGALVVLTVVADTLADVWQQAIKPDVGTDCSGG